MSDTISQPIHRSYARGWFGSHGIFHGLKAVESGEQAIVTFAIAPHPCTSDAPDSGSIFVTVGRSVVEGVLSWRFGGGDDGRDPDGHSSHALVASWEEQDLALAVAGLALYLQRKCPTGWAIYRQPVEAKMAEAA
ncbi:hypothetical protein [uncultured Devosia sp.]|uniref:hypothetical protein n=1 Tax=uncultured Devosia sp. TaxID=211434 RepID=UPI0026263642|nr:hypothetical protein [uncultured Devosia sp.]